MCDVELDTQTAAITALVVYGRPRLLGLLGREEDIVFPWTAVRRVGEDVILVEGAEKRSGRRLRGP